MKSTLKKKIESLFGGDSTDFLVLLNQALENGVFQIHGSPLKPVIINPTDGLVPDKAELRQLWFVKSNGGIIGNVTPITIAKGSIPGQEVLYIGCSDIDLVQLQSTDLISLNGILRLTDGQTGHIVWNGQRWSEITRR